MPPEEQQENKDLLTLTCLIQNFFPEDISVQWLLNGQPVPSSQFRTTEPLLTSSFNKTYFIFSRLEVSRTDWQQGNEFTCQVVHEALPGTRILERTVSRQPGN